MKKVFYWLLAITGVISLVLIGWASTSTAKEEIFSLV